MKRSILSRVKNDLWVILMDVIAVNAAFILALLLRYYVHFEFKSSALPFLAAYMRFAPYYTVLCIVVFYLCGLYDSVWRYAGLNDMNRIILASVITAVINVLGTKIFFGGMPKSYYFVGCALQFIMVALIRFSYRFVLAHKQKNERQKAWTVPAMVVGTGDRAREFIHYLEEDSPFQVMVIAGAYGGRVLDGIPIVDYASIPLQVQYHGVQAVFLADGSLTEAQKAEIRKGVEGAVVRDYLEYLGDAYVPAAALLNVMEGPVTTVVDGVERQYGTPQECVDVFTGNYAIKRIRGAKVELKPANDR